VGVGWALGNIMIFKIYRALLWFFGFQEGERITFMMRRQKDRLGIWWWVMVGGTIVLGNGFLAWLIPHILGAW